MTSKIERGLGQVGTSEDVAGAACFLAGDRFP
jgi:hypothetical protein